MEVLIGAKCTRMFKPSFTREAEGFSDNYKFAPILNQMLGVRDTLWFQLVPGCPGCFIWCSDADAEPWRWLRPRPILTSSWSSASADQG